MKAMKKVFAILLAVAMVMGLSLTAFAEGTAVAAVGDKTYTSISEAIEAANGGTVKLLANVSDVTIDAGTTVTIDLNGYTISSVKDHAITNNGTLTVTSTGTVDGGSTASKGALFNDGTAILNGGTFTTSSWYVIKNVGTLTINNGVTVSKTGTESGSAIDNGYASSSENHYGTQATLTINGGTFSSTTNCTVKNDDYGVLTINGGAFTNSAADVVQNSGISATITGGSFTYLGANDNYTGSPHGVILEYRDVNDATLVITGGDFTAVSEYVLSVYDKGEDQAKEATINISGGTFVGDLAEYVGKVTVSVSGGTFSDEIPSTYDTTDYTAPKTATIVVHGVAGQDYTAYKIFDVTQSGSAYAYSISASDTTWLPVVQQYIAQTDEEGNTINKGLTLTPSADGTKYVVEYVDGTFNPADFAAYLLANISGKTGTTATANSDGTATISGLAPGYYLVDSSLGALMILDTADVATVNEKNTVPTLTKEVYEDSTTEWGSSATADMQEVALFHLIVTTGSDASDLEGDYVIADTLPAGFTPYTDEYSAEDTVVEGYVRTGNNNDDYWIIDTDYTVAYDPEKNTLTFTLKEAKLEEVGTENEIEILYVLTVGQDAVVGAVGNTNTAYLTYHNYKTVEVQATVYTYQIGADAEGTPTIVKVDGSTLENDEVTENTVKLAGVKFVLSKTDFDQENARPNVTYYAVLDEVKGDDETTVIGYKLKAWTTDETQATSIVTDENGSFVVQGLDAHTYILTETETLDGYNLLNDTITVVIAEDGAVTYYYTSEGAEKAADSITVVNNAGTELPSTGGMGTTVFYVVGSILVIGAAVLLITKKRMTNVQ